jgi:hypothetical protein
MRKNSLNIPEQQPGLPKKTLETPAKPAADEKKPIAAAVKSNAAGKIPSLAEQQAKPQYQISDLPSDPSDWHEKPCFQRLLNI